MKTKQPFLRWIFGASLIGILGFVAFRAYSEKTAELTPITEETQHTLQNVIIQSVEFNEANETDVLAKLNAILSTTSKNPIQFIEWRDPVLPKGFYREKLSSKSMAAPEIPGLDIPSTAEPGPVGKSHKMSKWTLNFRSGKTSV